MRSSTFPVFLVGMLLLGGCAGYRSKYYQDGAIVSTTLPKMEIRLDASYTLVKDDILYASAFNEERKSSGNAVVETVFQFKSEDGRSFLVVNFVNMSDTHWYFEPLTCSGAGSLSANSRCAFTGKCCARVTVAGEDRSVLKKEYSLDFGRKAKLYISYLEGVSGEFARDSPLDAARKAHVEEFEQRADASFSLVRR